MLRAPVHVVWLAPAGGALRHAFLTGPAERWGWGLCGRYRGRRRLGGRVARETALVAERPRCPVCERAVGLVAVGLPRVDDLLTRVVHAVAGKLRRLGDP